MRRNQVAKLSKNGELGCGWFGLSFFHLCRVTELKSHANHFFFWFNQHSYGMALNEFRSHANPANRTIASILFLPTPAANATQNEIPIAATG